MIEEHQSGDVIVPGEKVYLGQPRKELAPVYRRWINDLHVATGLGVINDQVMPMTDQDEEEWFDAIRKDSSGVTFTIYERDTERPLGNVSLMSIKRPNRSAELGIVIGERSAQGKGYGTEATRLMLDYGFTLLGLNRIWLEFVDRNEAARRAYERAGFKEVGRAREAWLLGGRYYDGVIMDILAREFESPVLEKMLGLTNDDTAGSRRERESLL
jgi:RimJ/RimL family protein N-acetyltransferase